MHQPYRHTHTISTPFLSRPASGIHKYTRPYNPHKPIHQRPQTHAHTRTNTHHRYHIHTAPQTHNSHTHTASTPTQPPQKHTPTRRSPGPPTLTLTLTPMTYRRCCSTDALAGRMQSQPRTSPQLDRPGRQDQAIQNQTRQDQIRPSHWLCIRRDQQAGLRKFFCQT